MATESAITPYGPRNAAAPAELHLFSFLVGKWKGLGNATRPDGGHAPSTQESAPLV